jgi:hypothetical protein
MGSKTWMAGTSPAMTKASKKLSPPEKPDLHSAPTSLPPRPASAGAGQAERIGRRPEIGPNLPTIGPSSRHDRWSGGEAPASGPSIPGHGSLAKLPAGFAKPVEGAMSARPPGASPALHSLRRCEGEKEKGTKGGARALKNSGGGALAKRVHPSPRWSGLDRGRHLAGARALSRTRPEGTRRLRRSSILDRARLSARVRCRRRSRPDGKALTYRQHRAYFVLMRVNLIIDDDVAAALAELRSQQKAPLDEVLNDLLRRGLKEMKAEACLPRKRFETKPVNLGTPRITNLDNVAEVLSMIEGEWRK